MTLTCRFSTRVRVPSGIRLIAIAMLLLTRLAATPPNIVLIMADDMGFSDIGCHGGEISTPNIDRLAREGMMFTQFYNNAKCTTTRASLLSGAYPRGNGASIPRNIPTIAEALRAAGYQTGMSGKWHLGSKPSQRPYDRGFDEYYGLMDGGSNHFNPAQRDPDYKGGRVRVFGHNDRRITEFPPGFYTTDAFTDHAIETMRRFASTGRPFFLHLAYTAPHYPLHAFPEDIAKYRGRYRQGWDALRKERHARQVAAGLADAGWRLPAADENSYDWSGANQDWEDLRMATYAAMVDRMDRNIGRLLSAMTELGIERNTVIMFLSDNGGCAEEPGGRDETQQPGAPETYTAVGPAWGFAQNTPFRRYKSWVNEGGISTPFIVRWPDVVKPGARTNVVAHIIDVMPTCLEIANIKPPRELHGQNTVPMDGRSFAAVLRGGRHPVQRLLFWQWSDNSAVRDGRWKAVLDSLNPEGRWQLYDIVVDRTEMNDVALQYPEIVARLSREFTTWASKYDRRVPASRSE